MGLRTSTTSGLAGLTAGAVLWALNYFAPDVGAAIGADVEAFVIALVMYISARLARTPDDPGLL